MFPDLSPEDGFLPAFLMHFMLASCLVAHVWPCWQLTSHISRTDASGGVMPAAQSAGLGMGGLWRTDMRPPARGREAKVYRDLGIFLLASGWRKEAVRGSGGWSPSAKDNQSLKSKREFFGFFKNRLCQPGRHPRGPASQHYFQAAAPSRCAEMPVCGNKENTARFGLFGHFFGAPVSSS